MKIGDKVRFLNEVGGGVVSGFQGKNTVLVRDADGFDIPVLIHECVVVDTDSYNIAKRPTPPAAPHPAKGRRDADDTADKEKDGRPLPTVAAAPAQTDEEDVVDRPVTFTPRPVERRGADVLNVYLAYLPVDARELSDTAFEADLVNDSNYYLHFTYLSASGAGRQLRAEGTVEPNTKVFLEEFRRDALPELERVAVQFVAFKRDRLFQPKPAFDVELRLDGTKFYKLHTFGETDFFDEPALLCDVVRNDRAVRSVFVDAESLQQAMLKPKEIPARPVKSPARKAPKADGPLEVDLHAAEVLETTAGMSNKDILDYQLDIFRRTMDEHLKERGKRIVFIHGKGDGVLRQALLRELRTKYKSCQSQDASFREYGFGATMVTIR